MPANIAAPYSKDKRTTSADAEAMPKRCKRPTMKFVATKTADQLDLQALHRVRERLVSQRTGIINQIRAFLLERGIAVRPGAALLGRPNYRASSPRHPMSCRPAWFGSSRTWLATGAGSTSGSRVYRARSRPLRARMPIASG